MKYAFAGDRQISCNLLKKLIQNGYKPEALLVTEGKGSSHAEKLIALSGLKEDFIFKGRQAIKEESTIQTLKELNLDYIFGIHYPYIIPQALIDLPKIGFLNLHPAYLPYNKGWHTPSWAILEGTPYGATLHFMSAELDKGDIIHRKKIDIKSSDTANTLYQKVLRLEEEVFLEALEDLISLNPTRVKQVNKGTSHLKKDLEKIREIMLEESYTGEELLNKLRALTTNNVDEAAYFIENGKKISVQVRFTELP